MRNRHIGDIEVGAVGLGAMPLSIEGRPGRDRAVATVHAALDAGVTLIDTADSYHLPGGEPGHNEELVAFALAGHPRRADVLVASKAGRSRAEDGSWGVDGRPEHLKQACKAALKRLGVDQIGLYQLHKPDPEVDWAESVGALAELRDEGAVGMAGISNVDPGQIRAAHRILGGGLVSVQNRFSPEVRQDQASIDLCGELGIAYLPWSPLGGISRSSLEGRSALAPGAPYAAFHQVAAELEASPQQVCLAWQLHKSPVLIPIPGASRPETIRASAAAADLVLSPEQFARLDAG